MCLRKVALVAVFGLSAFAFAQQTVLKPPQDSKEIVVELKVTPVYPAAAKPQHLSGEVKVQVAISRTGDVLDARVVSGDSLFAESALTAARQWAFAPVYKDGQAVRASTQILFRFNENPLGGHDGAAKASSTSAPVRIALTIDNKGNTHCPEAKLLHRVQGYTQRALNSRVQGAVVMYVFINEGGNVTGVYPLSGPDLLRSTAVNSVGHSQYAPYTCEGLPTRLETTVKLTYTIIY